MSDHETFEVFHTIYTDPENPPILSGTLAERLATRADYLSGPARIATRSELKKYNAILVDKGTEAAKQWLTDQWA